MASNSFGICVTKTVFKEEQTMYNKKAKDIITGVAERKEEQIKSLLQSFRYIDDIFFSACIDENFEAMELILKIVLDKEITIKPVHTQKELKNLQVRSVILDVYAVGRS